MVRDIDFETLRTLRKAFGMTYPPGYVIFRQDRPGSEFYVILDGEVELVDEGPDGKTETLLTVLRSGDFFGEMAVFRGERRSATARARVQTSVLFFNARTATELVVSSPKFALGIIRTLCDRVAAADHEIVTMRLSLNAHREHEERAGLAPLRHGPRAAATAARAARPSVDAPGTSSVGAAGEEPPAGPTPAAAAPQAGPTAVVPPTTTLSLRGAPGGAHAPSHAASTGAAASHAGGPASAFLPGAPPPPPDDPAPAAPSYTPKAPPPPLTDLDSELDSLESEFPDLFADLPDKKPKGKKR
jgi:CRP-like cAMP-binding protein